MSKRKYHGWVVVNYRGEVLPYTFSISRSNCWVEMFSGMNEAFQQEYWKRWDASIAAAKRRYGYRIVRARVAAA